MLSKKKIIIIAEPQLLFLLISGLKIFLSNRNGQCGFSPAVRCYLFFLKKKQCITLYLNSLKPIF